VLGTEPLAEKGCRSMKFANRILGLMALVLMVGYLAAAQQQQLSIARIPSSTLAACFPSGTLVTMATPFPPTMA